MGIYLELYLELVIKFKVSGELVDEIVLLKLGELNGALIKVMMIDNYDRKSDGFTVRFRINNYVGKRDENSDEFDNYRVVLLTRHSVALLANSNYITFFLTLL